VAREARLSAQLSRCSGPLQDSRISPPPEKDPSPPPPPPREASGKKKRRRRGKRRGSPAPPAKGCRSDKRGPRQLQHAMVVPRRARYRLEAAQIQHPSSSVRAATSARHCRMVGRNSLYPARRRTSGRQGHRHRCPRSTRCFGRRPATGRSHRKASGRATPSASAAAFRRAGATARSFGLEATYWRVEVLRSPHRLRREDLPRSLQIHRAGADARVRSGRGHLPRCRLMNIMSSDRLARIPAATLGGVDAKAGASYGTARDRSARVVTTRASSRREIAARGQLHRGWGHSTILVVTSVLSHL